MAMDPYSTGLQAAGMVGGRISSQGAANKSKQLMGAQYNFARRQLGQYDALQPQYMKALETYGQNLGMVPGGVQGYGNTAVSPHNAARLGIDPNTTYQNHYTPSADKGYLMGPYDQQAYRLRRAQAEQDLQHQMQGADQNLLFEAQQRGLATGSTAAALAREHQGLLQGY